MQVQVKLIHMEMCGLTCEATKKIETPYKTITA